MIRFSTISVALVACLLAAPSAFADTPIAAPTDDAHATPAATETAKTTPAPTTQVVGTAVTAPAPQSTTTPSTQSPSDSSSSVCTTDCDSTPECTTDCEPKPPCTEDCTPVEPPCTENCTPVTPPVDTCTTDCIPVDTPPVDIGGGCVDIDCAPVAGAGVAPVVRGAGALPFTGIEDILLPSLGGLLLLLGGIVAYRYASVREVVDQQQIARPVAARRITGYEGARDLMTTDPSTPDFWGDDTIAVA